MKILSSLLLLGTVLQGCSSINQPTASRALVEHDLGPGIVLLPSEHQLMLARDGSLHSVQIDDKNVLLGPLFFAASGKTCRKVKFFGEGERVYCKTEHGGWYAVRSVLASYTETVSGGNK